MLGEEKKNSIGVLFNVFVSSLMHYDDPRRIASNIAAPKNQSGSE